MLVVNTALVRFGVPQRDVPARACIRDVSCASVMEVRNHVCAVDLAYAAVDRHGPRVLMSAYMSGHAKLMWSSDGGFWFRS